MLRHDRARNGGRIRPERLEHPRRTRVRELAHRRHKWFITGADGAAYAIVMARTSGSEGDPGGATMFLVDADNPGMRSVRHIATLDESLYGGHAELRFDSCLVPDGAVLGEVDKGFAYAQVRLGPARMTHCMRWLGIARRGPGHRGGPRRRTAPVRLAAGRPRHGAADDRRQRDRHRRHPRPHPPGPLGAGPGPIRRARDLDRETFGAEAVWRVVDRSLQLCGSLGVPEDVLLGRFLREVRPFRIYDGPSETHRWSIARRAVRWHEAGAAR